MQCHFLTGFMPLIALPSRSVFPASRVVLRNWKSAHGTPVLQIPRGPLWLTGWRSDCVGWWASPFSIWPAHLPSPAPCPHGWAPAEPNCFTPHFFNLFVFALPVPSAWNVFFFCICLTEFYLSWNAISSISPFWPPWEAKYLFFGSPLPVQTLNMVFIPLL